MTRTLRLSLFAAAATLAACKPGPASYDAGCNQAFAGAPDGSINPVCAWTTPSNSTACQPTDLQRAIGQAFGDAGACTQDSDCVFFNDAGPFTFDCYTQEATNPVALANVPGLLTQMQGLICGFCATCEDGGGALSVGLPTNQPQSQSCLQCFEGQCVANLIVADAGQ